MLATLTGGSVPAGKWTHVILPVSLWGINSSKTIPRIAFQAYSGDTQSMMYVADVEFLCVNSERSKNGNGGNDSSKTFPTWAIALIVIGSLAAVCVAVALIVFFVHRAPSSSSSSSSSATSLPSSAYEEYSLMN